MRGVSEALVLLVVASAVVGIAAGAYLVVSGILSRQSQAPGELSAVVLDKEFYPNGVLAVRVALSYTGSGEARVMSGMVYYYTKSSTSLACTGVMYGPNRVSPLSPSEVLVLVGTPVMTPPRPECAVSQGDTVTIYIYWTADPSATTLYKAAPIVVRAG